MTDRLVNEPTEGQESEELEIFDLNSDDPMPVSEETPTQEQSPSATEGQDNHPEEVKSEPWMQKYQGKSDSDLIEMHRQMESRYSQLANERHTLSQEVERLTSLSNSLNSGELDAGTSEGSDIDDLIFDKPTEAINKAITSNPLIKDLLTQNKKKAKQTAQRELYSRHENFDAKSSSPEFIEWVGKNPQRVKLAQQAAAQDDYGLAGDLMDMFDEVYGQSRESALEKRNESLGKIAPVKKTVSGQGGRKKVKYRASQIRQLYNSNPAKYDKMSSEFQKAYKDGRVIND